ncbi:MAG: hypothetical protein Q7L55_11790 [Actinomycetota bacterium]|nr:hypothetical protein [Actinomycetota bacterium]
MVRTWTAGARIVVGLLVTLALVLPAPGAASAAGLGTPPPDCGAVGKDYSDSSCTTQTRNGTFSLDSHVVRPGQALTGTVANRCSYHSTGDYSQPPDKPCPIEWNQLAAVGSRIAGCTSADATCTVRIPAKAKSSPYRIVTVGISSDQGTGISKDYFGIVGGKVPEVDWGFKLRPFCGKDLCLAPKKDQIDPEENAYWRRSTDGYYSKHSYSLPTGRGQEETQLVQYRPAGTPIAWRGQDESFAKATAHLGTQSPNYVISAHGGWEPTLNGFTRVPDGSEVVTYVPLGTAMDGSLGPHVDTGHLTDKDNRYKVTYKAGDLMPNFTFLPFDGAEGLFTKHVSGPTTLNDQLRPNMGVVAISACASMYLPAGSTLEQSLAASPVYIPGSSQASALPENVHPTLTPAGVLQFR